MKDTPKKVMEYLCGQAWASQFLSSSLKPRRGKPGEFLEHCVTAEQREILKNLKPEDVQNIMRPEFFC